MQRVRWIACYSLLKQQGLAFASSSSFSLFTAVQSSVQCQGQRTSLLDIAISGVPGWITIAAGSRGRIAFNVWTARGVQVFLRPPIPCPNPALDQTVERRIGDFVCWHSDRRSKADSNGVGWILHLSKKAAVDKGFWFMCESLIAFLPRHSVFYKSGLTVSKIYKEM